MRIGYSSQYLTLARYQQAGQQQLNDHLTQMSSGRKIQFGYQGSTIFSQTLRLDYEEATLSQSRTLSTSAKSFSDNTDSALSELSKTMTTFTTKLNHAANQIHSATSLEALANDLQAIRDHMLSIANTSIGGQYIFSGTDVTTKPFDPSGKYHGNNAHLEALLGSNNLMPYNITGSELFFGKDSDKSRLIVSNVKNYNQSKLHPDIMTALHKTDISKEVYITHADQLRDLIGDSNDDPTDSPDEWFYIQGVRPDGSSFKSKFSLTTSYTNDEHATTVQDLLDRIGKEFGNTALNKVVDVTINEYGAIQIKDLTTGRSNINFFMVSSDSNVNDLDDLTRQGARVKSYVQSPFLGKKVAHQITSTNDYYDHRLHHFPQTFRAKDNSLAEKPTRLRDILGDNVTNLSIGGRAVNNPDGTAGAAVAAYNFAINANTTMQDLIDSLRANFVGTGEIEVEFSQGKLTILDKNVRNLTDDQRHPPFDGASSLNVIMQAQDGGGANLNAFSNDYTLEYDRVGFTRRGSLLTSNVSQVINRTSDYALPDTKLSEVAGASLHGSGYVMELHDINGVKAEARIAFNNTVPPGTTLAITSGNPAATRTIPLFNPHDAPPAVTPVRGDEMTYQQLLDAITLVMNHSNLDAADYATASGGGGATLQDQKSAYERLLQASQGNVSAKLNDQGQVEIKDLLRSETRMNFMIYNATTNDYTLNAATGRPVHEHGSSLTFQANNALTIDDPHVNFFTQIDAIIDSVRKGTYRSGDVLPGTYSDTLRSTGIQGGMTRFEHLSDHVNKIHARNGAQGNAFKYSLERTEILIVHTKTLRSEVADTDIASTYNSFAQLTLNYQAMLSSIGKINQLSLVNYI